MPLPGVTAFRCMLAILAYNTYLSVYYDSGSSPNAIRRKYSPTTKAAPTPSTFLTAEGLYKPSTVFKGYDLGFLTLHNIVQCYIAYHVAILYIWPFWRVVRDGSSFGRFSWNLVAGWSLAFFIYIAFSIVEKYYHLA